MSQSTPLGTIQVPLGSVRCICHRYGVFVCFLVWFLQWWKACSGPEFIGARFPSRSWRPTQYPRPSSWCRSWFPLSLVSLVGSLIIFTCFCTLRVLVNLVPIAHFLYWLVSTFGVLVGPARIRFLVEPGQLLTQLALSLLNNIILKQIFNWPLFSVCSQHQQTTTFDQNQRKSRIVVA